VGGRPFRRRDRRPGAALAEGHSDRGLWGRPCPVGPGPRRVVTLGPRRRSARPGPAGRLAGVDPGPFRSTRLAAGGAGFPDVLRHRRRAASPDRLGGLQAGGWARPDQPPWGWVPPCPRAGPGSRVPAGRRPPQRHGRTDLPRGQARRGRYRRGRPLPRREGPEGWRLRGRSGGRATSRSRRRCRAGDPRREARFPPGCVPGPPRRVPRLGFASPDPRRRDPPPRPTLVPDPLGPCDPAPWSLGAAPPSAPEHRPAGPWPGPVRRWPRWSGSGRWSPGARARRSRTGAGRWNSRGGKGQRRDRHWGPGPGRDGRRSWTGPGRWPGCGGGRGGR
jgi:hypothetical protein